MHLLNILSQFNASKSQKIAAIKHFTSRQVTVQAVKKFLGKNKF
jgi:hypothetical protein